MNFAEWGALNADERREVKWHRRPHIKTATLFAIVLTLFAILFIVRVGKNEVAHLSKKPDATEAYTMAQKYVKDKLKLPASANFPKNKFESQIDTANNLYALSGIVDAQATDGHFIKQQWFIKLKYTGGDWAERKSWIVQSLDIK